MILSKKRITKVLIRLRRWAGWSAPVLFANPRRQVFSRPGSYLPCFYSRYMLELQLEQVKTFVSKVEGLAKEAGCKLADKSNPEKANFLKMAFERDVS